MDQPPWIYEKFGRLFSTDSSKTRFRRDKRHRHVAAHKGDFDPARLFRQRKSSIYVLRYLGHFPIMRLEACERGMRNNISTINCRVETDVAQSEEDESFLLLGGGWMEQDRNRSFFFSLLLLFFSFSRFATPNSFDLLPSPWKNEYTKLRNLRKLSSFPWYYLDRWWFFGRKKFILTRILTFLVAFW